MKPAVHPNGHEHENHMTNSHLLVHDFSYHEPGTVNEAISLLHKYEGRAQLIAGGTNILIDLKMERVFPDALISLAKVSCLDRIEFDTNGNLVLGPLVSILALRDDPVVQNQFTALSDSCAAFGSTQIQIMGTIGGNICNGSPASDTVPALMALNARLTLTGPGGERTIPIQDFLLGPGKTDIHPDEILTAITIPPLPPGATSSFYKMSRVTADLAKASIAIVLLLQGDRIEECRISFGSVAPTVVRLENVENTLRGQQFSQELLDTAGSEVFSSISPITDVRSTADYRQHVSKVMFIDLMNEIKSSLGKRQNNISKNITPAKDTQISINRLEIPAGQKKQLEIRVNGTVHTLHVSPNELLLNTLREKLFLTGSKYGCGLGECSACTVLIDGKAILSCLALTASVADKNIITIEGLQKPDGTLDPLQQAFIDHAAFQCGYCTPGFIMTAKSLINEKPDANEDEVRDYLKGNRCRCTGYTSIVRAVMAHIENSQKNNP